MQVKGQAISPPHNYPVLKQESGIDWPGSGLGDWTCQSLALPGWASPCKRHGPRIYEMCAKGLRLFSSRWRICRRDLGGAPGCGAVGSVRSSEGGQWAVLLSGQLGAPTLSNPAPPGARMCVTSAVPRQGQFFLILPCKFLGLPAAKLLPQPPRPHPVWQRPRGSMTSSSQQPAPVPRSLWVVPARCQRSLG